MSNFKIQGGKAPFRPWLQATNFHDVEFCLRLKRCKFVWKLFVCIEKPEFV